MTKTKIIFFLLISISLLTFGQIDKKIFATTFYQFDLSRHTDSTLWELRTDKFIFSNKSKLDTLTSGPHLDSLIWFLTRHPHTVIEIILKKDDAIDGKYSKTKIGQSQTQQIVNYLSTKGIDHRRILANDIHCGSPLIIDDSTKISKPPAPLPKRTKIIWTFIRVLSEDFVDPNANKNNNR
jgi:hypothetical protein